MFVLMEIRRTTVLCIQVRISAQMIRHGEKKCWSEKNKPPSEKGVGQRANESIMEHVIALHLEHIWYLNGANGKGLHNKLFSPELRISKIFKQSKEKHDNTKQKQAACRGGPSPTGTFVYSKFAQHPNAGKHAEQPLPRLEHGAIALTAHGCSSGLQTIPSLSDERHTGHGFIWLRH